MFHVRRMVGGWVGAFLAVLLLGSLPVRAVQVQPKGPPDNAAEIKALLKERYDTLDQLNKILIAQYKSGTIDFTKLAAVERDLLKAALDLHNTPQERLAMVEKHLQAATDVLAITEARFKSGTVMTADVLQAKAFVLEARVELLRAQAKVKQAAAGEELASTTGKVTFDGKPLASGNIVFHLADGRLVGAKLQADGTFKVDRLPVGTHRVTIEATMKTPKGEVVPLLPSKYAVEEQSTLQVEVKKGANTHNFELGSK